ncbi:MAG: N-6 DNA methylase, partial [Promethearchaeota archaeon]
DPYNRFNLGFPPASSGDWGWIQHMYSSLSEEGKMVVVLDTGSVSRGSGVQGNHRERDIRKYFITQDLIEAIVLLPENLFYNTAAPGVILIINRKKKRKHLFLMINASKLFHKKRPKNVLPNNAIEKIYDIYAKWREVEGISKIISVEVAIKHDYNLIPSLYVVTNDEEEVLSPHEAILRLKKAEKGVKKADSELKKVLNQLGLEL